MKKIRILAAFLASLMLLGTFASCAENTEAPETGKSATNDVTNPTVEADTTEAKIKDNIPADLRYEGDEIVIISRYREGWSSGEMTVEKLTSEPVNDAVYARNQAIEERLGVKLTNIEDDDHDPSAYINRIATVIKSGTHEYDLVAGPCYSAINESLNGTFADIRKADYIDLDKPWWSQGFNEVVEYQGSQYAATGSMLLSMYRFAFVTVFNKDMFTDHKVPFLYEDVANKTWTLDRQIELVPIFHSDAVNQGKQDVEGDIFGLVSNDYISVDPYWSSCNVDIIQKNSEGEYEIVFDSGKLHGVAEKVLKLFYGTGDAVYNYKHEGLDDEQVYIRDMFANDGAAMATVRLMELESSVIRNMASEYGVVPMPKYDNAQEEYRTFLHDQFTVLCIPNTIYQEDGRLDEIGAAMEIMGSESHYTVRPAYYETTLRTKLAQDPESAEMLDMVVQNIYIDAGIIYTAALNSFHDKFRKIVGSQNNTVASDYKSASKLIGRSMSLLIKKLDKIKDNT